MTHTFNTLFLSLAVLCFIGTGTTGCGKPSGKHPEDKGNSIKSPGKIAAAPGKPSPKTDPKPRTPSPTPPAPSKSATPPAVNPLPGGPALQVNPVAGLDLAASTQGVLSGGLKLEPGREPVAEDEGDDAEQTARKAPSSNSVDDSFVAVKEDGKRHPLCQRLLACTREAVRLAPGSVTSYNVTRESVDSLEDTEAEAECRSDLSDLRDILRHLKKEVPATCR